MMGKRFKDWLVQAESYLEHAKKSLKMEDYNWVCFAAQQCAEKALKAFYDFLGGEDWGHMDLRAGPRQIITWRVPVDVLVKTRQEISLAFAEDNRLDKGEHLRHR